MGGVWGVISNPFTYRPRPECPELYHARNSIYNHDYERGICICPSQKMLFVDMAYICLWIRTANAKRATQREHMAMICQPRHNYDYDGM